MKSSAGKSLAGNAVLAFGILLTIYISVGVLLFGGIGNIFTGLFGFHLARFIGGFVKIILAIPVGYTLYWLSVDGRAAVTGGTRVNWHNKFDIKRLRS